MFLSGEERTKRVLRSPQCGLLKPRIPETTPEKHIAFGEISFEKHIALGGSREVLPPDRVLRNREVPARRATKKDVEDSFHDLEDSFVWEAHGNRRDLV